MKILAVETSAVSASAAVVENGAVKSLSFVNAGLTHSCTLMPMLDSVLSNAKIGLDDIDLIACSAGPGSFTGIRIGICTVKGLCDGAQKPCMPVSTLQALAYNLIGQTAVACCVMDARCKQVYTAMFKVDGDEVTRLTDDEAISIEELSKRLEAFSQQVVFVGDGAAMCHRELGHKIAGAQNVYQSAVGVAFAAQREYNKSGKAISAAELTPVYLRLPQAERELAAKRAAESKGQ